MTSPAASWSPGTRAGNASRPRGKRSFLRPKPHVLTDVLPDRSGSVLHRVRPLPAAPTPPAPETTTPTEADAPPPGPAALRTHARPGQARPGSEGHSATDVSPSAQWGQNAYPRRPLEGPEITATTAQRTSTGSCSYSRHRRPVAPAALCTCGPPGARTERAARVCEGQRQPGGRPPRHRDSAATSANGSPGSDGTRRP